MSDATPQRIAVVTPVAGRHAHLTRQHASLAAATRRPDRVVVVAMGDPEVADVVAAGPLADRARCLEVARTDELPLAEARNLGVGAAFEAGADLAVLLDVDCLASPDLLRRYADAARTHEGVLCGPVAYLPPPADPRAGYTGTELAGATPHVARPAPAPGALVPLQDWRLFWSLSFAVTETTWSRVGGFDEGYTGYGAEDTDLGQRAARAGVAGWWVGGATAYHQWHPVSDPPVEHLAAIVRNANRFQERWGWFPMEGWLAAFERAGLAGRRRGRWEVLETAATER